MWTVHGIPHCAFLCSVACKALRGGLPTNSVLSPSDPCQSDTEQTEQHTTTHHPQGKRQIRTAMTQCAEVAATQQGLCSGLVSPKLPDGMLLKTESHSTGLQLACIRICRAEAHHHMPAASPQQLVPDQGAACGPGHQAQIISGPWRWCCDQMLCCALLASFGHLRLPHSAGSSMCLIWETATRKARHRTPR